MSIRTLVSALAALALIPAASAAADQPIAEIGRESPIAAYAGWEAWSAFDEASGSYALTLRDPQGTVKAAPLAPSDEPWDVSLGPDAHGDVVAVYRSCGPDGCGTRRDRDGLDRLQLLTTAQGGGDRTA